MKRKIAFITLAVFLITMLVVFLVFYNQGGFTAEHADSKAVGIEKPDSEYPTGVDEDMQISVTETEAATSTETETTASTETDPSYVADWSDITTDGLDENAFIQKLDTALLQEIAAKLQALVKEELEEEDENPEVILTEGFARVFKKKLYLEVIDMGEKAEMPLYYILYKSPNDAMYEHICAVALSELTGYDFMNESGDYYDWTSGKEYLELFDEYMLNNASYVY